MKLIRRNGLVAGVRNGSSNLPGSTRTSHLATRPVPPPRYQPQPKPRVLQPKAAGNQPSHTDQRRQQPVAPLVYTPQPVPRVLQRKAAREQQPLTRGPVAPPAYRPQPLPYVLQLKRVDVQREVKKGALRHPTAPPVYRPQPTPKVLQAKINAQPAPSPAHSRKEWAKNLPQSKINPGRTVIQRQIATKLEAWGLELEKSEDAYQRSKNRAVRGQGKKPLLSIKIKDSQWRLHVHLVPHHLIRQMTGWNIKDTDDRYIHDGDLKTSMILDVEDRALLDTYAPRWKDQGAYPGDITWQGRTPEEVEMIRQEELLAQREDYARRLEGQLEGYVERETNKESSITETYVFAGPRARKKKGETAAGYKRFIDKDKSLPVVADVQITANVFKKAGEAYESVYRVKCVYSKGKYLAKKDAVREELENFAKELNVAEAAVVTSDWNDKKALTQQARIAHIKDIRDGNQDAEVRLNF